MVREQNAGFDVKRRHEDVLIGQDHKDVQINIGKRCNGAISIELNRGMNGRSNTVYYEGPYEVTSNTDETLVYSTEGKTMNENLVVLPIPYNEISNTKGGVTVSIGGD